MSSALSPIAAKRIAITSMLQSGLSQHIPLQQALTTLQELTRDAALIRWVKNLGYIRTTDTYHFYDKKINSWSALENKPSETLDALNNAKGELERAISQVESGKSTLLPQETNQLKTLRYMLSLADSLIVAAQDAAGSPYGFSRSLQALRTSLQPQSSERTEIRTDLFYNDRAVQGLVTQATTKFDEFIKDMTNYIEFIATTTMINRVAARIISSSNTHKEVLAYSTLVDLSKKLENALNWANQSLKLLTQEFNSLDSTLKVKPNLPEADVLSTYKLLTEMRDMTTTLHHRVDVLLHQHSPDCLQASTQELENVVADTSDSTLVDAAINTLNRISLWVFPTLNTETQGVEKPDFHAMGASLSTLVKNMVPNIEGTDVDLPSSDSSSSSASAQSDPSAAAASASYTATIGASDTTISPNTFHILSVMQYIHIYLQSSGWGFFKEKIMNCLYRSAQQPSQPKELFNNYIQSPGKLQLAIDDNKQELVTLLQTMLDKCAPQPLETILDSFKGVQNPLPEEASQRVQGLCAAIRPLLKLPEQNGKEKDLSEQATLAELAKKGLASDNLDAKLLALSAVVLLLSSRKKG